MLARDSQYATACQLETEEDPPVLAVSALIADPVSLPSCSPSLYLWGWEVLIIVNTITIFHNTLHRVIK